MSAGSCGALDAYDYENGSLLITWPPFPGTAPDSFNVYVNGVFNQNVPVQASPADWLLESGAGRWELETGLGDWALEQGNTLSLPGQCTISGLQVESYNPGATPPVSANGPRPESMSPVGLITDSGTYDIKVVAVVGGVEVAASMDKTVTVNPTSIMLRTPMKRLWPFPSTGLD